MTLGFILLESLNNLSTTFRFFLPRISTQFTSGNWLIIFLVLEMLLGRFDQTLFNFSFIHSIEREKSVYGCFYWFFCYWGLFLNNIFLISKIKCSNLMYSADCRIFFYVSSWRQNTLDQEKCLEFFLFIMSKLQDSLRVEKILLVNILSTFRARKPKIFYVSTEETSTTLSTHTICYVSSTANTQCGRKKRRCVFCFIDPSFFKFIVSCSGLIWFAYLASMLWCHK